MRLWTVVSVEFRHTGSVCVRAAGSSVRATVASVCAGVSATTKKKSSWKFTGEMFGEGGGSPFAVHPGSQASSPVFQPPVLKCGETHSGNGDNSAVIAGDL